MNHVLLTHIHGDHIGGLFQGEAARYPNAQVHVPRGDLAFYVDEPSGAEPPAKKRNGIANVKRLKRIYGDRVSAIDIGPVLPGINAMALPGHTPGHTGFLVHDDRRSLLVWADIVHLDALQLADPDIGLIYDIDPAAAIHSRQMAFEIRRPRRLVCRRQSRRRNPPCRARGRRLCIRARKLWLRFTNRSRYYRFRAIFRPFAPVTSQPKE